MREWWERCNVRTRRMLVWGMRYEDDLVVLSPEQTLRISLFVPRLVPALRRA